MNKWMKLWMNGRISEQMDRQTYRERKKEGKESNEGWKEAFYLLLHSFGWPGKAGLQGLSWYPSLQRSQFNPAVLWVQLHKLWT